MSHCVEQIQQVNQMYFLKTLVNNQLNLPIIAKHCKIYLVLRYFVSVLRFFGEQLAKLSLQVLPPIFQIFKFVICTWEYSQQT